VPPPLADLLATGQHYHRAGALARAAELYHQVVEADPSHAEAWFLLGQACQGLGQPADAAEHHRRALGLRPDFAPAHNGLGIALARLGDRAGAEANFRRAVALQPAYAQAVNNLGNVLKEMGRRDEAEVCYEQAAALDPGFGPAHANLGWLLLDLDRPAEAEAAFRRAVQLGPGSAEARHGLAGALARQRRWDEAVAAGREAVRLRPDFADAHAALAGALGEAGKPDEALAHWREAVRLAPASAPARTGAGLALFQRGEVEESLTYCREAVRLQPDSASAHVGLGLIHADLGRLDEALACYARALGLTSDHPEARRNRALLWLLRGDFARGWPEYEWRWRCKELPPRPFPRPRWDGGPLEGKTILLHAEQGLGDTFQFIRYAPLVKRRGGTVVVACQRPLMRLLEGCPGIDRLAAQGDPLPPFDVHAPLLSLPLLFGTDLKSIPADAPYLRADPALVEQWRAKLAALPGFRVGVAWKGSDKHKRDHARSVPLAAFEALARVEGVRLVSLQKGAGSEQVRALAGRFPVAELPGLDERNGPFVDTAAVLSCLDLVVCCDTALGHLAGALGVPCWLALMAVPNWRWLLGRDDSPWYPRHRLFRQDKPGDWDGVFRRIADALRQRVAGRVGGSPVVTVEVSPGELLDKIAILEIKSQRISDPAKLRNVTVELWALEAVRRRALQETPELAALAAELRAVNEALWEIEDDVRRCERDGDFGPRFVELARSVYRTNDRRAALKRRVNDLLGARVVEEKSYADYGVEKRE
jgi:tetratricopeptide (TPR) repeat protein